MRDEWRRVSALAAMSVSEFIREAAIDKAKIIQARLG